jgi:hypothetical protein
VRRSMSKMNVKEEGMADNTRKHIIDIREQK